MKQIGVVGSMMIAFFGWMAWAQVGQVVPRPTGVFATPPAHITPFEASLRPLAEISKKQGTVLQVRTHDVFDTPRWMHGMMTEPSSDSARAVAMRFLETHRNALKLGKNDVFRMVSEAVGPAHNTHLKFRLYRDELEVWPAEVMVHLNARGVVTTFNGIYRSPGTLSTVPSVGLQEAVDRALAAIAPEVPVTARAELIIYDWHVETPVLAYKVRVRARDVFPLREDVFIDAHDGHVINRIDMIFETQKANAVNCTVLPYRNDTATRSVGGYDDTGNILLVNTSKRMFPGALDPNTLAGTIVTFDAQHTNASQPVPIAYDPNGNAVFDDSTDVAATGAIAYWVSQVYDWLWNTFQRDSYDGNGAMIKVFANFREDPSQGYDNAFWDGAELVFGDGGTSFYNLAYADDVTAHELGHAITSTTAQLVYQFQSGALNEGFSDMYASLFDSDDWLIGERIMRPETGLPALRSMEDPHMGRQQGQPGWLPRHMSEYQDLTAQQDNGGVHVNCGIMNFAFYKMATSTSRTDAGRIIYHAECNYLTRNSEFADMRTACEKAAADLFGQNHVTAVQNAFAQVGVGEAGGDPGPGGEGQYVLYFPFTAPFQHYNVAYNSHFYVSNPTGSRVTGTVTWYGDDGSETFEGNLDLGPHTTAGSWSDPGDQWILIEADGPIIGAYQHMNATGTSWSLIPATPYVSNGMYIPHIATNTQKFWTVGGLAIVRDTPSSIIYADNILDDALQLFINSYGEGVHFDFEATYLDLYGGYPDTRAAGGLWGLFVNFDLDETKMLDYNMAGAEIFGRKDAEMAAGLIMDATTGRTLIFPHVAANTQTFWTGYSVVNVSDPDMGDILIRVTAYDGAGRELANNIHRLPAFGKLLRVTGDDLVPVGTSWFMVSCIGEGASITGMELFGSQDDRQLAGFQALPWVGKRFFFPFVVSGDRHRPDHFEALPRNWTGISIVNPNASTANVTVRLYVNDGTVVTQTRQVGPKAKLLDLLQNIFQGTHFFGYVEITSDLPVNGFSLCGFDNQQELAANPMVFVE